VPGTTPALGRHRAVSLPAGQRTTSRVRHHPEDRA
jgi:hypothetical protein